MADKTLGQLTQTPDIFAGDLLAFWRDPGPLKGLDFSVLKAGFGLGAAAFLAVGATAGTVAAGDDGRFTAVPSFATGQNGSSFTVGLKIGGGDPTWGAGGTYLRPDGSKDWPILMPSVNADGSIDAVELALNGGVNGDYTAIGSTVTLTTGQAQATWVGHRIILENAAYPIVSVAGGGLSLVVTGSPAAAGTWIYAPTTGSGLCSIAGSTMTRLSGDPLIGFTGGAFILLVNGSAVTVLTTVDQDTYILTAPPGDHVSTTYSFYTTINDQIATFRLARRWGANEENISFWAGADGYWIHSLEGSTGAHRKVILGSGEVTSGILAQQITAHETGDLSLNGDFDYEAVRILNQTATPVNRWETISAPTGVGVVWRARGSDTNVPAGIDTKGAGNFIVSSHSFGFDEFTVFANGGAGSLAVGSDALAPALSARGAPANLDIKFIPKGSGLLWVGPWTTNVDAPVNGYVMVKDTAGIPRKVATIA